MLCTSLTTIRKHTVYIEVSKLTVSKTFKIYYSKYMGIAAPLKEGSAMLIGASVKVMSIKLWKAIAVPLTKIKKNVHLLYTNCTCYM